MKPKLSIILTVLNSHEIFRRQMIHISKIMPDWAELIIVDDGSEPEIPLAIPVDGLRYRLIRTYDHRPWTNLFARNTGARMAQADILVFWDVDHILTRKALEAAVNNLHSDRVNFWRRRGVLDEHGVLRTEKNDMSRYAESPNTYDYDKVDTAPVFACRKKWFFDIGAYPEPEDWPGTYIAMIELVKDFLKRGKEGNYRDEIGNVLDSRFDQKNHIYVFPNPAQDVGRRFHGLAYPYDIQKKWTNAPKIHIRKKVRKVISVGSGRCGSRNVFRMYSKEFPEYVQATHDSDPWWPKEYHRGWELGFDHPEVIGRAARRFDWLNQKRSQDLAHSEVRPEAPELPWIELSAYQVPYIYGMCKHDPELEVVVQLREPEGFVRSCLNFDVRHLGPFLAAKQEVPRWKMDDGLIKTMHGEYVDYPQYYYDVYTAIWKQLEMLGKQPLLVMDLSEYSKDIYNKELLQLFDIPIIPVNLEKMKKWTGTKDNAVTAYGTFTGKRSYKGELPDLEFCWDIYTRWMEEIQ